MNSFITTNNNLNFNFWYKKTDKGLFFIKSINYLKYVDNGKLLLYNIDKG